MPLNNVMSLTNSIINNISSELNSLVTDIKNIISLSSDAPSVASTGSYMASEQLWDPIPGNGETYAPEDEFYYSIYPGADYPSDINDALFSTQLEFGTDNVKFNLGVTSDKTVVGSTGRIFLRYTKPGNFRGDLQITKIQYGTDEAINIYDVATTWQTISAPTSTADYDSVTGWVNIGSAGNGKWGKDTGGTPTGGTGVTVPSPGCIFYESSGIGSGEGTAYSWLRSPEVTFTSDLVKLYIYAHSKRSIPGDIGAIFLGVEIT